jgi:hypothetical protein
VTITVIIELDDFPQETGWYIEDLTTGTEIIRRIPGTYGFSDSRTEVEETVIVLSGSEYAFVIEDANGDGLCCQSPGSFYFVFAGEELLGSGGEDFGAFEMILFEL